MRPCRIFSSRHSRRTADTTARAFYCVKKNKQGHVYETIAFVAKKTSTKTLPVVTKCRGVTVISHFFGHEPCITGGYVVELTGTHCVQSTLYWPIHVHYARKHVVLTHTCTLCTKVTQTCTLCTKARCIDPYMYIMHKSTLYWPIHVHCAQKHVVLTHTCTLCRKARCINPNM